LHLISSNENDAIVTSCHACERVQVNQLEALAFIVPHLWLPNISDVNQVDHSTNFGDQCNNVHTLCNCTRHSLHNASDTDTAPHWHMGIYHKRALTKLLTNAESS